MIAIVDYGMGNLRSVQKALEYLGAEAHITSDPATIRSAEGVVLPGVGAFGSAMQRLDEAGLTPALRQVIEAGKPFLGICLGLQLLFESSEESPGVQGLSVLRGRVAGFRKGQWAVGTRQSAQQNFSLPVPQIGWNAIRLGTRTTTNPLWRGVPDGSYVYFVHSYYAEPAEPEIISATTLYGIEFTSAVSKGALHAVQFHPEKSSHVGLAILRNFLEIVARGII